MKNVFRIVSVFVGTVIGAGFASGKELLTFFAVYGYKSFYGILICGVFFALLGTVVLCKIERLGITNYHEYFRDISGRWLTVLFEIVISLFMLCSFSVMIAGTGSMLREKLGWSPMAGACIMCVSAFIIMLYGVEGITKANMVMAPLLVAGMVFFALYILVFEHAQAFLHLESWARALRDNWLSSALLYASYNTITLSVILTTLHKYVKSKQTALAAGSLSAVVLCVVMVLLLGVIFLFYNQVKMLEIPFLYIAAVNSRTVEIVYLAVMFLAMLTTAVSSGFGVISILAEKTRFSVKPLCVVVCIAAYLLSCAGFGVLVSKVYAFFGYFGLFIAVMILIDGLRYLKK